MPPLLPTYSGDDEASVSRVEVVTGALLLSADNHPVVRTTWARRVSLSSCVHASIHHSMHTTHVRLLTVLSTGTAPSGATYHATCNACLGGDVGTLWFTRTERAAGDV